MARVREVYTAGANGDEKRLFARFTLEEDGTVRPEYVARSAKDTFDAGIWSVPDRRKVRIAEGRAFFEALPKCWGASSRFWTRDVE